MYVVWRACEPTMHVPCSSIEAYSLYVYVYVIMAAILDFKFATHCGAIDILNNAAH